MNHTFDVIVVGGGIVGLTAALSMAKRHYSVAVIDAGSLKTNLSEPDLRVYAINHSSQHLLQKLNVWQQLDTNRISPYHQMHVWDALSGAHIDFDSRMIAMQHLGSIIEESVLKQGLLQEIGTFSSISLFPNESINEVTSETQEVRVSSSNATWKGQLLFIADGANSPTRQKLNVELTSWLYNQQAIVATVKNESEHQKTAYQVFHPSGPLAFLPLADPHHCSIVWSVDLSRAKELMTLNDNVFNIELNKAFAKRLGEAQLTSARHQFPLVMRHAKQYSGDRWLLIGDAAHTIHPLAGLGLNLGLADVSTWIKLFDDNKGKLISKKLMGAFQRERKHAVWQTIALMEGFKRLFSYSNAPITSMRGIGLRACNEFSPIKRLFIQHATG